MYPNIICFCGCPLGHLYNAFKAMCIKHRNGPHPDEPIGYILDALNITKDCCRMRIMTNVEFKNYYNVMNPTSLAPMHRASAKGATDRTSASANKQIATAVAILTAASEAAQEHPEPSHVPKPKTIARKGKRKM